MPMTRSEIDSILQELEHELPMLLQDNADPDDFWMAFAAMADAIEDGADPEDLTYVRGAIDGMLAAHRLGSAATRPQPVAQQA